MPSRHIVKTYVAEQFYHVFNRGVARQDVFKDDEDYTVFLSLLKRHLSPSAALDNYGRPVTKLHDDIELVSYCLMPNHFHLLVYTLDEQGLPNLMRRVMTAYSMYFNKKHKRVGSLFQDTYKAVLISSDSYLQHISRYIHLNPMDLKVPHETYPFSSYGYYLGSSAPDWLHPERILELFDSTKQYQAFVADYESAHDELKNIKRDIGDW